MHTKKHIHQIHQLVADRYLVHATLKWLMNFPLLSCMSTVLFFKFSNHLYNILYSLRSILHSFVSNPLTFINVVPSAEDLIIKLFTSAHAPQFAYVTIEQWRERWSEWTGLQTGNGVVQFAVSTSEWFGMIDFQTAIDRSNVHLHSINVELLNLFRQRDAFLGFGKWVVHAVLTLLLLVLFASSVKKLTCKKKL